MHPEMLGLHPIESTLGLVVNCKHPWDPSNVRSTFKYVAVLCLLLTLWSAVAIVVHHHDTATESVRCTVCIAAHSAAPKAATALSYATFVPVFVVRAQIVSAKATLIAFALSVRPPPAA